MQPGVDFHVVPTARLATVHIGVWPKTKRVLGPLAQSGFVDSSDFQAVG
jgi:hypothetical protein